MASRAPSSKTAKRRAQRQRRRQRKAAYAKMGLVAPKKGRIPPPPLPPRRRVKRPALTGRGGYYDANGSYQRGFAPGYGSRLGGMIGDGIQSLAEVVGFGDYSVKQNSLAPLVAGNGPPMIKNLGRGDATIIRHREYIGDLVTGSLDAGGTSTLYTTQEFPINPGNSSLFPWLANIAENFQFYELNGCVFELKSESSTYAANMAMGAMFVATDYNTLSPPPLDKQALLNMEFSTSTKPSESQIHLIECARNSTVQEHLYVANDLDYVGGDPHFYNLGTIFVGSYGCPKENTKIAEMWISYEVALYRPKLSSTTADLDTSGWELSSISGASPTGVIVQRPYSAQNYSLSQASPTQYLLTLPNKVASYLVTYCLANLSGSSMTVASSGVTSATGCTLSLTWPATSGFTGNHFASPQSVPTGGNYVYNFIIEVTALLTDDNVPSITFDIALGPIGPSPCRASLDITSVDRAVYA